MVSTPGSLRSDPRGLGLLLALSSMGCLGLPRFEGEPDDDGGTDTEGPPTPTATGGPTVTGGPTSTGTGTTTTTTSPTSTGTTTSTTTPTTSPPPPPPPPPPLPDVGGEAYACQAYADLISMCYGEDPEQAYSYCFEYWAYVEQEKPQCLALFEEAFVCLSSLTCEQLQQGLGPCEPLFDAFFQCP